MKHLYESIFNDDILDQDHTEGLIKERVFEFLEENYALDSLELIKRYNTYFDIKIDPKFGFVVNYKGSLRIRKSVRNTITSLTNGLFKFGTITGDFDCMDCPKLKSLEGAPEKVYGWFDCRRCHNLKSLEGAPKKIADGFNCMNCENLITLKGAPIETKGINCNNCPKLKSLEGAPEECGWFYCEDCISLTTLEGAPKIINGGNFECNGCKKLTSLKGGPEIVDHGFTCNNCPKLKSLEGAPKSVYRFTAIKCGKSFTVKDIMPFCDKINFFWGDGGMIEISKKIR